jgi:hypothetical protein
MIWLLTERWTNRGWLGKERTRHDKFEANHARHHKEEWERYVAAHRDVEQWSLAADAAYEQRLCDEEAQ